jgi:hypothetical protein
VALDRLDMLVREARARTGNQDYVGDQQGVPQRDFVAFANDAQDRIFNLMMQTRPTIFVKEGFLSTVKGVGSYALPSDVYIKHNVTKVDYSPTGDPQMYFPLSMRTARTSEVSVQAYPDSYFLRDGNIILSPLPPSSTTNALRLNYQYVVPRLDVRRAKINTVNTGTGVINLVNDTTLSQENVTDLSGGWVDFICVVDATGTIVDLDRSVVSYNATTRDLTCASLSGSLAAPNQYIVFGKNTTTNSALPDVARRYLVEYMVFRAQMRDTSGEAGATSPLLQSIEAEIVSAIEQLEEDILYWPLVDRQFLNYSDDWE